jgi:hypothetical protein
VNDQPSKHPDGHVLLDGARWHYPKMGEPTACAVRGCTRVLGQQPTDADADPVADADAEETPEPQAA